MTQLLRHALTKCHAVPDVPLDIQGLIFILIERSHLRLGKLRHAFDLNGYGVQHNGNELSGVAVKGRCSRLLAAGLRYIEHLLHIVGDAGRAVVLGVLHGFENGQALSPLVDLHAVLLPVTEILELGRLRLLLVNKQSVCGRVAIHSCLRVKIGSELVGVTDDLGCGVVDHLIYSILLRLFLGGIFLRGELRSSRSPGLLGSEIIGHS